MATTKQQLEAKCAELGVELEVDRAGRLPVITLYAPEGQQFAGTGGRVLVTGWDQDWAHAWPSALADLEANLPLEPCDHED